MEQVIVRERDGFRITRKNFVVPRDAFSLEPVRKREITICNLFVNHELPIPDISRILDETYPVVVNVLIKQGLISERRQIKQVAVQIERRRSLPVFSSL